MPWQFDHFDQIQVRVDAAHAQTGFGQAVPEFVVQFVTMAVPFVDGLGFAVGFGCQGARLHTAGVGT
jgi:hypothetical protein